MKKIILNMFAICLSLNCFGNAFSELNERFYVTPESIYMDSNQIYLDVNDQFVPVEGIAVDTYGIYILGWPEDYITWECPRCHKINDGSARTCKKCGRPWNQ